MRVLVTGASGLVGRELVKVLAARGDHVVALSRAPQQHAWPDGVEAVPWDGRSPIPGAAADAVVNLAGERVVGRRWDAEHRRRMRDSRVGVTRHVVDWARARRALGHKVAVVSASAAGYYGDADGPCREDQPPGAGYLAEVARDWEAEARRFEGRLVVLRLGHVLSARGGYLGTLLPIARLRLAGPIAGGRQPMPWVHIEDAVRAFLWALGGSATGTFNVVSPGAAGGTQKEFAAALASTVRKPRQLAVPLWAIRAWFGGAGPALAGGQDLRTEALLAKGFVYRHPALAPALQDLVARPPA